MSEQEKKSGTPTVLGIIGIVLAIPHLCCAYLCAAAATVAVAANEIGNGFNGIDPDAAAVEATANTGVALAWISTLALIAAGVLCLFCKHPKSKVFGSVALGLSILATIICLFQFSVCGIAAGTLGIIGGVISMKNAKLA